MTGADGSGWRESQGINGGQRSGPTRELVEYTPVLSISRNVSHSVRVTTAVYGTSTVWGIYSLLQSGEGRACSWLEDQPQVVDGSKVSQNIF